MMQSRVRPARSCALFDFCSLISCGIGDSARRKLIFEMDVDFVAVGFRAVLSCTVRT